MGTQFRRPVYNGDRLTLRAGALQGTAQMRRADVLVINEDGEEVATGWIGMPDAQPPLPDLSALAVVPRPDLPPEVKAGELIPGLPLTTADRILTEEDFKASLQAFGETEMSYVQGNVVHSGCLMRLAMGDTHHSFRFPSAVVLTAIETQHFAKVAPGQQLATVGTVAGTYLRKGKYYLESEEFMLADSRPVARFLRTQIYAYEPPATGVH
jgi:hypothetical protein